mmetsp:Transcript_20817/g.67407  ORF Transcript_20817/g.67407 Transcript_20817/m.67407 type:complete len:80 (+) Transcript_20817:25-264(+)
MSERELLVAQVKAHSQGLLELVGATEGDWEPERWRTAFESLFLSQEPSIKAGRQQDDLLFFVKEGAEADEGSNKGGGRA